MSRPPIQTAAWKAWQKVERNGDYLDVSPVPVPAMASIPMAVPLAMASLERMWVGNLLPYSPPLLPAEIMLQFHFEGKTWKRPLDLEFYSKDERDRSLELARLRITKISLSLSCTNAPLNPKTRFTGVSDEPAEFRGTAEASPDSPNSSVRIVRRWLLH